MRVDGIISNSQIQANEMHCEIVQRLQSVALMLQAIFILLIPQYMSAADKQLPRFVLLASFGFSALVFFASYLAFLKSATTRSALLEAQKNLTYPSNETPNGAP